MTKKQFEENKLQLNTQIKELEKTTTEIRTKIESSQDDEYKTFLSIELNKKESTLKDSIAELEQLEAQEERMSIDWSSHDNPMVVEAQLKTQATGKKLNFAQQPKINKILREFMSNKREVFALMPGPTGSGKTSAVKWLGAELNKPVISQNFSGNMEELDIIGGPAPDPTGKQTFIIKDGPLMVAVKLGLAYVAEEINNARPNVITIFNSLTDDNRSIVDANGEVVTAHPEFKLVGTYNPGYAGTRELNKSLINRATTIIELKAPTPIQLGNILDLHTNNFSWLQTDADKNKLKNKLIALFKLTSMLIKSGELDAAISPRQLIEMAHKMKSGWSWTEAFKYGALIQMSNSDEANTITFLGLSKKVNGLSDKELDDIVNNNATASSKKENKDKDGSA